MSGVRSFYCFLWAFAIPHPAPKCHSQAGLASFQPSSFLASSLSQGSKRGLPLCWDHTCAQGRETEAQGLRSHYLLLIIIFPVWLCPPQRQAPVNGIMGGGPLLCCAVCLSLPVSESHPDNWFRSVPDTCLLAGVLLEAFVHFTWWAVFTNNGSKAIVASPFLIN